MSIEPALTAEEWPEAVHYQLVNRAFHPNGVPVLAWNRHKTAARCLYGQPFGFTRSDVENHRMMADHADAKGAITHAAARITADWHRSMADRIEALLPPEKS